MNEPANNENRNSMIHLVYGFFMGAADIVPGVSGGTVALILGIYERLVTAISHLDFTMLDHVRHRRLRKAVEHSDLQFLITLAVGVASGFLVMTMLMSRLLGSPDSRSMTFAAFFGLILGSAIMVSQMIRTTSRKQTVTCIVLGIVGAGFAFWLTTLNSSSQEPSYGYIFLCASVAICAMILPGISGAMILLILGVYEHLAAIPHKLLHGEEVSQGIITIAVFMTGAGLSLILFSRLLRWLLSRFHSATMAVLCGFMVGALPKIWPFQRDVTPDQLDFKLKQFELMWPESFNGTVLIAIGIAISAAAIVLVVERYARTDPQAK